MTYTHENLEELRRDIRTLRTRIIRMQVAGTAAYENDIGASDNTIEAARLSTELAVNYFNSVEQCIDLFEQRLEV